MRVANDVWIMHPSHEINSSYSITSSARASSEGGTLRPSVLAALRLITKSNLVDSMTGRSAGFSPLRILPAYINAGLAIFVRNAGSVAHETASGDELTIMIECRNGVAFRQRDQLLAPHIKERVGGDNKRSWCRNRKGRINLGFTACRQDVYFYCDGASHFLNSFRLSIENRPRWVQEHGDGVDRWNQLA